MSLQLQQLRRYGSVVVIVIVVLSAVGHFLVRRGFNVFERGYLSEPFLIIFQALARWLLVILVILFTLQQVGIRFGGI